MTLVFKIFEDTFAISLDCLNVSEECVTLRLEDVSCELASWRNGSRGRVESIEHGDAVGFAEWFETHLVDQGLYVLASASGFINASCVHTQRRRPMYTCVYSASTLRSFSRMLCTHSVVLGFLLISPLGWSTMLCSSPSRCKERVSSRFRLFSRSFR